MVEACRPEDLIPRVYSDMCARCRKNILPGHRIIQVHISHGRGTNPRNLGERGLFISDEYEFIHVDCHDPFLKKPIGG